MPRGKIAERIEPPSWAELFQQWPLIEWDFVNHLRIDASKAIHSESFRWFVIRLMGLVAKNGTALHSYFSEPESETSTPNNPREVEGEIA